MMPTSLFIAYAANASTHSRPGSIRILGYVAILMSAGMLICTSCGAREPAAAPVSGDAAAIINQVDTEPGVLNSSLFHETVRGANGVEEHNLHIYVTVDDALFGDLQSLGQLDRSIKLDATRLYSSLGDVDYIRVTFVTRRQLGPFSFSNSYTTEPVRAVDSGNRDQP